MAEEAITSVAATPEPAATTLPSPTAATPTTAAATTPPPVEKQQNTREKITEGLRKLAESETVEAPANGEAPASTAVAAPEPEPDYKARAFELEEKIRLSELEKDRVVQEAQIQQLNDTERQAVAEFKADIAPDEALAWEKYNQAQEALKAGEYEDYQALDREYAVMRNRIVKEYNRFNSDVTQHRSRVDNVKQTQFEKAVTNQLKEFDLSVDEVLKVDPKALSNPFAFNKATLKAKETKHAAELKALKEQIAGAEKSARAKWESESPASVTGQGSGGSSGGTVGDMWSQVGKGKSARELISAGLKARRG